MSCVSSTMGLIIPQHETEIIFLCFFNICHIALVNHYTDMSVNSNEDLTSKLSFQEDTNKPSCCRDSIASHEGKVNLIVCI